MIPIKTILCPIDLGPASDRVANYAASFARIYGAKVHLLHVVTPPPTGEYEYPTTRAEIIKSIEEASFCEMETAAEQLEARGIGVQIDIRTGDVHETIKQHISFVQPDFIVMGAQENGSQITLLHVVDDTNMAISIRYGNFLLEGARMELEDLVPRDMRKWFKVSTELQEGSPYRVILRTLQRVKPDLLVMNIHSKGLLDRALHGNTAERVVRTALCPVMLIPQMKAKARLGGQAA